MMDPVHAPQERHRVKQHVLAVDQEVEDNHRQRDLEASQGELPG
jgi:hypothetical protein